MRKILIIAAVLIVLAGSAEAQKALKLTKQQTTFFYTQVNVHGGYIHNTFNKGWDVIHVSPSNQIAFTLLMKDQERLQRGYTSFISPVAYQVRLSVPYNKSVSGPRSMNANFSLRLLDSWIKFDTKWDRTAFWVGVKGIPYGHNPKLDPVSSFMTNLTKMDLGFTQDLGFFVKTPVSGSLDLEASVTSGGFLNRPICVYDDLISSEQAGGPTFSFSRYSYDNTWLVTSRIGQQSFRKNELGAIAIVGKIYNTLVPGDQSFINRIGMDWVHKHYEKLRLATQATVGYSDSDAEGQFGTLNTQAQADFFLVDRFVFSTSIAVNYHNSLHGSLYHLNYLNANSITYLLTTHTRLRANVYYTGVGEKEQGEWGILFQIVTGIGTRN